VAKKRFPAIGSVLLLVLEEQIQKAIGKGAITELRAPLTQSEISRGLTRALATAEQRLLNEFPESVAADALKQLPINTLQSMGPALWAFFEDPSSPVLHDTIEAKLAEIIPQDAGREQVAQVANAYFRHFREAAISVPHLGDALNRIAIVRTEANTARSAAALETLVEMRAAPRVESIPPNYDAYLRSLEADLGQWQNRYAPMFAKFRPFTLFARVRQARQRITARPLRSLIQENPQLTILGPAGSGKTTTINKVALEHAGNFMVKGPKSLIPIIVPLRDYGPSDLEAIMDAIVKPFDLSFVQMEADLQQGRFLLIFDGLNEVPSAARSRCFQEIRIFSSKYRWNRFLYTSRDVDYQDDWISHEGAPVPACEIEPLSREQIQDCVRRYFGPRSKTAKQLIEALGVSDPKTWANNKSLLRLARVPLLLQMLIVTYEEKKRIPRSEGDLLLGFVNEILLRREPGKAAAGTKAQVKLHLLSAIARKMHEGEQTALPSRAARTVLAQTLKQLESDGVGSSPTSIEDVWQELQNNNLIIDDGTWVTWPHPLHQDLFAGMSLGRICFDDNWSPRQLAIQLELSPQQAKWYGRAAFDAGLRMLEIIPEERRLQALVAIATVNPPLAKEAFGNFEPEHHPSMMDDLESLLGQAVVSGNHDGAACSNLLQAASLIGARFSCELFAQAVVRCPAWEGRLRGVELLWAHCKAASTIQTIQRACALDPEPKVRRTAFNELVRSAPPLDDALLSFLVGRYFEETEGFLSDPQLQTQPVIDSARGVAEILSYAGSHDTPTVQRRAAWCMGRSTARADVARKHLTGISSHHADVGVRATAAAALATYPSAATRHSLSRLAMADAEASVRISAIESLASMPSPSTIAVLIKTLSDPEAAVRATATRVLINLGKRNQTVDNRLLNALSGSADINAVLHILSQVALAEQDPFRRTRICKALSTHYRQAEKSVQLDVALALRNHDTALSHQIIRDVLNGDDPEARARALEATAEWGFDL
jgi:hypothetical protein